MIRKASLHDLDNILSILKSIGHALKDPTQGFLMADYTKNEDLHRQKYAHDLAYSPYTYVYEHNGIVEAFLIAYPMHYWLNKEPNWLNDIYWHPNFDKARLNTSILIYQTAMYPHLTGKGIGSKIYKTLFVDLKRDGITNMFAETLISPIPNFASLNFRIKQKYELAGMRYEIFEDNVYTTLIYNKGLDF